MSEEDSTKKAADSVDTDCGLSFYDELAEKQGISVKAERSPLEDAILQQALAFQKTKAAKRADRPQQGPSPSDFGDHEPIPLDTICIVPVFATGESVVENVPETVEELEQDLKERRTADG